MSAFDLCKAHERRFLCDLMQDAADDVRDHPIPELHALLRAVERLWGGHYEKPPFVLPKLIYYLAVYARYVHEIPEDPEAWRRGAAHDVYRILQGFMDSVARAIKDGSFVKHENGGVYMDLFAYRSGFMTKWRRTNKRCISGK